MKIVRNYAVGEIQIFVWQELSFFLRMAWQMNTDDKMDSNFPRDFASLKLFTFSSDFRLWTADLISCIQLFISVGESHCRHKKQNNRNNIIIYHYWSDMATTLLQLSLQDKM